MSGTYPDHGARVNSVFTSYRISGTNFSQCLGNLAGPAGVEKTSLKSKLVTVNSTKIKTINVPYLANFSDMPFLDCPS